MEHERARRDAILAGLGAGPKTQAQLAEIAGVTRDTARIADRRSSKVPSATRPDVVRSNARTLRGP
jgi:hypothetical protein